METKKALLTPFSRRQILNQILFLFFKLFLVYFTFGVSFL